MTAPKIELLPCPCCGSSVKSRTTFVSKRRFYEQITCDNQLCPLEFTWQGNAADKIEDIKSVLAEKWNTRAPIKPSGEVRLSLTVGELDLIIGSVLACKIHNIATHNNDAIADLLTVIRSQTKDANQSLPTQGIKE